MTLGPCTHDQDPARSARAHNQETHRHSALTRAANPCTDQPRIRRRPSMARRIEIDQTGTTQRNATQRSQQPDTDAPPPPEWSDLRLRRTSDIERVIRHGRVDRGRLLNVAARRNDLPHNRYGLAVSRRVGGAVRRNRVKRQLRAAIRSLPTRDGLSSLDGLDIVVTARPAIVQASYGELSRALSQSLVRVAPAHLRDNASTHTATPTDTRERRT